MVIAFPPHVVALLRGRMLRPKLERLVTAACSAVPMNSRAWVTRARPCFEQGPVLPYTPRGYCSSCPLVGTVLGVPRTPRGSTGRAAFLCLRRRCERISSRELLSGTGRSLHSSRHPSGFMHAVVLRACVHCAPAGPAPAPHDVVARERAHPAPPPAAASDRAAAPRTLSALIRSSRPEPEEEEESQDDPDDDDASGRTFPLAPGSCGAEPEGARHEREQEPQPDQRPQRQHDVAHKARPSRSTYSRGPGRQPLARRRPASSSHRR